MSNLKADVSLSGSDLRISIDVSSLKQQIKSEILDAIRGVGSSGGPGRGRGRRRGRKKSVTGNVAAASKKRIVVYLAKKLGLPEVGDFRSYRHKDKVNAEYAKQSGKEWLAEMKAAKKRSRKRAAK